MLTGGRKEQRTMGKNTPFLRLSSIKISSSVNYLVLFLYPKDKIGHLSFAYWFTEALYILLILTLFYIQIISIVSKYFYILFKNYVYYIQILYLLYSTIKSI